MVALWRGILSVLLVHQVPGWWWREPKPGEEAPYAEFTEPPKRYAGWVFNQTQRWGWRWPEQLAEVSLSWDSWFWTALDLVFGGFGWIIFGKSWSQVRLGVSVLFRVGLILGICLLIHYVFALCWPIVSLLLGVALTVVWLVRSLIKVFGRATFLLQRLTGGIPEAADAVFFGPDLGEVPETSELRKLKKGSDGEKMGDDPSRWIDCSIQGLGVFEYKGVGAVPDS